MPDVERKPCQKERKERVGKTSERQLLRKELQTQGGVHRKARETGTRKNLKEGPKRRIENKELIVNGKVVLTNCKML